MPRGTFGRANHDDAAGPGGPTPFPVDRSRALADVSLGRVREARARIANCVHISPTTLAWLPVQDAHAARRPVTLKMENRQVAGTVASRGVSNLVALAPPDQVAAGLVTVWLGRCGPAVLRAGLQLRVPTTVYMARSMVRPEAVAKFRSRGGKVVVAGATWHEAERLARRRAEREGACFVHPFADPGYVNGCGTLALELFETLPPAGLVVVPASPSCGLGLLGVLAMLIKELQPGARVVGVERAAAPLVWTSLEHGGRAQALDWLAPELGPRQADQLNVDLARRYVDEVVLVSEEEVRLALATLWYELEAGSSAEGVTALAAVLSGRLGWPGEPPPLVVLTESGFHGLF